MLNYTELYIGEINAFIVLLFVGIFVFRHKKIKGISKYIGIIFSIFVISFGITFFSEKPQMDFSTVTDIEINQTKSLGKPKTIYHFKDVTDKVEVVTNLELSKLGEYKVLYEFQTPFFKYSEEKIVKVKDTLPPEIMLEGNIDNKQSYTSEYQEPGYKAFDLNEGDLSDKITVEKKEISQDEYYLIYTVSDSLGNKVQKERHITIVDDIAPDLSLNGNNNYYLNLNDPYEEQGAIAIDEKEGDLTDKIEVTGSANTAEVGTYTINYKVQDSKGNIAEKNRYISVFENGIITGLDGTNGKHGVIYLTFDDGPTTTSTPRILEILRNKGVKATFFVINYNSSGEELIRQEIEEGHTVAIHGYSHKYGDIYKSVDSYLNNIYRLKDRLIKSFGYDATITRFPGGSSNTVSKKYSEGIMTTLTKEMVARGFTYFDWNVDSDDAGHAKSSEDVYNNVTSRISKDKANVVLMHDFSNNFKTIDALEQIIDFALENGYTFETITPDTAMVTHTVNN